MTELIIVQVHNFVLVRRLFVSALPGCVDDVTSPECDVDLLVVVVVAVTVIHTNKYLLTKGIILYKGQTTPNKQPQYCWCCAKVVPVYSEQSEILHCTSSSVSRNIF